MGFTHWLSERFSTPEEQMARLRHEGEEWADQHTVYAVDSPNNDKAILSRVHPTQQGRPAKEVTSVLDTHPDDPGLSATFHLRRLAILREDCSKLLKPEELTDIQPNNRGLVHLVEFKPDWMDKNPSAFTRLQEKLRGNEGFDSWPGTSAAIAHVQPQPPSGGGGIGKRVEDATTMRFMP